jgi:hypothetical protein
VLEAVVRHGQWIRRAADVGAGRGHGLVYLWHQQSRHRNYPGFSSEVVVHEQKTFDGDFSELGISKERLNAKNVY